jgi:anti-sigma regulatory factor (Ser/Thr protein kinase)
VSHDGLLAASGHHGIHVERLPLALADLAASDLRHGPAAACGLAAIPESAKIARDFTSVTLQQWGLGRHIDTAELVVSELVTNALRHGLLSARGMLGEHPVGLRLLRNDPYLICMVTDPGSAVPVQMETCAGAESGRGLQVVQAYSVEWGWEPLEDVLAEGGLGDGGLGGASMGSAGKVVWALLHSPELQLAAGRPGRISRRSELGSAAPGRPVRRAGRRTRHPWPPGGTHRSRPACR